MPSRLEPPSLIKTLHKIVQIFEKEKIDYMLIGGLVLPAYGQIRTTQDIDIAVTVKNIENLKHLFGELRERSFEIPSSPMLEAACAYLFDTENAVDVEIWQKPDGIIFDEQLFRRRNLAALAEGLQVWIIGPEDFIINKLARKDRRVQDETDVISVLVRQKGELDEKYLAERAKKADVQGLLEILQRRAKTA